MALQQHNIVTYIASYQKAKLISSSCVGAMSDPEVKDFLIGAGGLEDRSNIEPEMQLKTIFLDLLNHGGKVSVESDL